MTRSIDLALAPLCVKLVFPYSWLFLNVPDCSWMFLTIPDCSWLTSSLSPRSPEDSSYSRREKLPGRGSHLESCSLAHSSCLGEVLTWRGSPLERCSLAVSNRGADWERCCSHNHTQERRENNNNNKGQLTEVWPDYLRLLIIGNSHRFGAQTQTIQRLKAPSSSIRALRRRKDIFTNHYWLTDWMNELQRCL